MSNIYVCQDAHLGGKLWAVKEFTASYQDPNEQAVALKHFEQEAHLLAKLSHPNLPTVSDYFQFQGKYYLAMDYIEGDDLGRIMERHKGPFPEQQVAEWSVQTATVLYYLHCHKPEPIIFRDVKPSNIIICRGTVKLIDFGIARHFNPSKKGDTMRIGSPGYAPPEQYSGQTDQRSDIYSLGVTMHQAITGRDPTQAQSPFGVPPAKSLNPNVSEAMNDIIARATKLLPEDRYQTMLEMKRDIRAILHTSRGATAFNMGLGGQTSGTLLISPTVPPLVPAAAANLTPDPNSTVGAAAATPKAIALSKKAGTAADKSGSQPASPKLTRIAAKAPGALDRMLKTSMAIGFFSLVLLITGYNLLPNTYQQQIANYAVPLVLGVGKLSTSGQALYEHQVDPVIVLETLDKETHNAPDSGLSQIYRNNCLVNLVLGNQKMIASTSDDQSTGLGAAKTLQAITIDVLVPAADAESQLRGLALAQKVLNNRGGINNAPLLLNVTRIDTQAQNQNSETIKALQQGKAEALLSLVNPRDIKSSQALTWPTNAYYLDSNDQLQRISTPSSAATGPRYAQLAQALQKGYRQSQLLTSSSTLADQLNGSGLKVRLIDKWSPDVSAELKSAANRVLWLIPAQDFTKPVNFQVLDHQLTCLVVAATPSVLPTLTPAQVKQWPNLQAWVQLSYFHPHDLGNLAYRTYLDTFGNLDKQYELGWLPAYDALMDLANRTNHIRSSHIPFRGATYSAIPNKPNEVADFQVYQPSVAGWLCPQQKALQK